MLDWIPLDLYTPFYFGVLVLLVLLVFLQTHAYEISNKANLSFMNNIGWVILLFVIIFIGFRQYSGAYFGDTSTYKKHFLHYQNGGAIFSTKDIFFHVFTKLCAQLVSLRVYFVLCAILYVFPLYLVCKKWFKAYWFYGLLFLIVAFSFWPYGTNGIRNGISTSLFLLGISRERKTWQIVWILLAIGFHKSIMLPTAAFVLANFYNQPKKLIYLWLLCIPLSLVGGGFFESFFASLGFDDDRISYLTDGNVNNDEFSSTGFRWDFLVYSGVAVFFGWYYIFKKDFKDKIYFWLFNTYVLSNAFWILVIRANFSNRFAYLSWFMMSLVIIYPLLKKYIISKQHKKIGLILLGYSSFTFIMNLLELL